MNFINTVSVNTILCQVESAMSQLQQKLLVSASQHQEEDTDVKQQVRAITAVPQLDSYDGKLWHGK